VTADPPYRPRNQRLFRIVAWTIIGAFVLGTIGGFLFDAVSIGNGLPVYKPTAAQRDEINRLIAADVHEAKAADFLLSPSYAMRMAAMSTVADFGRDNEPTNIIETDIFADMLLHTAWVGGFEEDEFHDSVYHRAVWTNQQKFADAILRAHEAGTLTRSCDLNHATRALWFFIQTHNIDYESAANCEDLLDRVVAAIEEARATAGTQ